jgi:hypothetical protein
MNNDIILLKVKERLNKLSSQDYDNLDCWQIVEAFNKGQVAWCRRQLHGMNTVQEGDEQSKRRIDDMQILLTDLHIQLSKRDVYEESPELPIDYLQWKRISANARHDCCRNAHKMVIYLVEEANVDQLLIDNFKQPSYEWGETFCTLKGNHVLIYTNGKFSIENCKLVYYRQPRKIEVRGCVDPYTQTLSVNNIECEFKDDITEIFIDEAIKILAGDMESFNQQQTATGQVETNN